MRVRVDRQARFKPIETLVANNSNAPEGKVIRFADRAPLALAA